MIRVWVCMYIRTCVLLCVFFYFLMFVLLARTGALLSLVCVFFSFFPLHICA